MFTEAGIALLLGVPGIVAAATSTFRAMTRTTCREDALRVMAAACLIWTAGLACVVALLTMDTTWHLWMGWLPYGVPYAVALGMLACQPGVLPVTGRAPGFGAAAAGRDSQAMPAN